MHSCTQPPGPVSSILVSFLFGLGDFCFFPTCGEVGSYEWKRTARKFSIFWQRRLVLVWVSGIHEGNWKDSQKCKDLKRNFQNANMLIQLFAFYFRFFFNFCSSDWSSSLLLNICCMTKRHTASSKLKFFE